MSYQDTYLYSKTSPEQRTCSVVDRMVLEKKCLYIIPSPVLFYGIKKLLGKLPQSSALVCIETDRQLYEFSLDYIPAAKLSYYYGETLPELLSFFDTLDLSGFRKIKQIILGNGYALNKKLYSSFFRYADERLSIYWKNKMTMIYMSRMWINNIFLNLASVPTFKRLDKYCTDKAVLVTGAGESLEQRLPEISRHRSGIYILCVDTALPVLKAANIKPDGIVAVESQHANLYDFLGSSDYSDVPLFYDLNSHFKIHSCFNGLKIPFLSEFRTVKLFDELEDFSLLPTKIPPLGSVGLTALHLASMLSTKICGYIGLDFSYRPGKPHARGTESHKRLLMGLGKLGSSDYSIAGFKRRSRQYEGLEPEFHSDPILSFYARQCFWLLQTGNYADCGTNGFVKHDRKMSIAELSAQSDSKGVRNSINNPSDYSNATVPMHREKVRDFLTHKKETLELLKERMNKSGLKMTREIETDLRSNDFIYADFPEQDIFILENEIIMTRLFTSLSRYIATIEKALIIAFQHT